MVTIINGYRRPSPIAQGIENVAKALYGDQLTPALKRAQLERTNQSIDLADREQQTKEQYAAGLGDFGNALLGGVSAADAGGYNRLNVASTLLSEGVDPLRDPRMTSAQLGAGQSAGSTGQGFLEGEANQTARSKYSADTSAGATITSARIRAQQAAEAAAAELAERTRQFNQTPQEAMVGGRPVFVPRSGAFGEGVAPILSETDTKGVLLGNNFDSLDTLGPRQANVVGALPSETDVKGDFLSRALAGVDPTSVPEDNILAGIGLGAPKAPNAEIFMTPGGQRYFSRDGGVTSIEGTPMEPGGKIGATQATNLSDAGLQPTNAVSTDVHRRRASLRALNDTVSLLESTIREDPTAVGAVGNVRRGARAVGNLARSFDTVLGGSPEFEQQIETARADLAQQNPDVQAAFAGRFDPGLSKVVQLYNLTVYQLAGALAGQEGRGATDADIRRAERMVGADPTAWTADAQTALGALSTVRQLTGLASSATDEQMRGTFSTGGATGAPVPGTIEDGYRFLGGDPANPASWQAVQ